MSHTHIDNSIAAAHYKHVLQLLGIPAGPQDSLTNPVKVVFKTTADRDAYLKFTQSDPEKHAGFPMELNSYNIDEIVVTPEKPLVIEPEHDGKPAILNIGTLTMEPGGQIICKTTAFVTVGEFVKN